MSDLKLPKATNFGAAIAALLAGITVGIALALYRNVKLRATAVQGGAGS